MIEQYHRPRYVSDDEDTEPEALACPVCKRIDATTKASAVARMGRGRLLLEDGTAAAYEGELSALLSRPPRPELLPVSVIVSAIVVGWLLLALDLAVVAGLRAQDQISIPASALNTATYVGLLWFGILIPGAAVVRYFVRRETVKSELPAWREAAQRWQGFHYCSRDDMVYVPGEGHGVAPEHIALLYRRAEAQPVVSLQTREAQA